MATKKPEVKQEEKKTEQPSSIQLTPACKAELEGMKNGNESFEDVIRRLIINHSVRTAPEAGMVTCRMTDIVFKQTHMYLPTDSLRAAFAMSRVG